MALHHSDWPVSGGHAGELIRAMDWSKSPLGTVSQWPRSLRTLIDLILAADVPMMILWGESYVQFFNDAFSGVLGPQRTAAMGRCISDSWPGAGSTDRSLLERVLQGQTITIESIERPTRSSEADCRVAHHYSPLRDETGAVAGILQVRSALAEKSDQGRRSSSIRDESRDALPMSNPSTELQHHVRNLLAVVRSIARRTAETSADNEDYAALLDGRLNALARAQAIIMRDHESGADLEELITDELLAQVSNLGDQVRVSGPTVLLGSKAAENLALALHELTTNAIRFGALANSHGRIQIDWGVRDRDGEPMLQFAWTESADVDVRLHPRRKGFGTEVLERTLVYELGAKTSLAFTPGGLRCQVDMPLNFWTSPWAAQSSRNGGDRAK